MALVPQNAASLSQLFRASANQLVIERAQPGGRFDLVLRDSQTGFAFFDIEGQDYDYNASTHLFHITEGGRLLISEALANNLGSCGKAGAGRHDFDRHGCDSNCHDNSREREN